MCEDASRFLGLYTAALSAFHDAQAPLLRGLKAGSSELAGAIEAKEAAQLVLLEARRRYWEHVRSHGCRERMARPELTPAPLCKGNSEFMWQRVEHAKRELDLAFHAVHEAEQESRSGALPAPDGRYAYRNVLNAQNAALSQYRAAVDDWMAVLPGQRSGSVSEDPRRTGVLTPREREVLTHIAAGRSSREIAGLLGIAFKTVIVHRHHIQTKLKVHNTADLTRTALRMGLIEL